MKKSKLDTPHVKAQVVRQLAIGESQNSIAKQTGLHQSQISRFAGREEIKALIEQEQMRLLEVIPDAVENLKTLVTEMKNIPEGDIKQKELAYKASKDVLKSVGLLPTPVHSQTFISLYQENHQDISPLLLEILRQAEKNTIDDTEIQDIIDPD
ncbi:MAG: hypothetical protein HZA16_02780 [Nitrospirae bacterium]|nr:hypothetical protein [Nitrospirota bacterium]